MAAIQVVNFFKQGLTGGAFEPLGIGTGDPTAFAVTPPGTISWLADLRAVDDASPCEVSVTAFGFHDQTRGIEGWVPDGSTLSPPNRSTSISPPGLDQPIIGGNQPTVNVLGTAADNVNATMVIYHSELPGSAQHLYSASQVRQQCKNIIGVDVTVDPSSQAQGDWSAPASITSVLQRLDAARMYALVGFTSPVPLAAVGVLGFETSQLRVGGPILAEGEHDAALIMDMSDTYNDAQVVPVFSGSNQQNIFVQAADPAAGSTDITIQLADLTGAT